MQIAQVLLMSAARNPLNVCPYWVGDILTTMSEIQPAQRWPGTKWERITDCFLRAADDSHPAGTTGGAWTHTQTVDEIAKHTHRLPNTNDGIHTVAPYGAIFNSLDPIKYTINGSEPSANHNGWAIAYEGSGQPMDITNKYTAVNMWRRTA